MLRWTPWSIDCLAAHDGRGVAVQASRTGQPPCFGPAPHASPGIFEAADDQRHGEIVAW
ncbi:hypothetical protein BKA80DRAFT_285173 [Phyllosticta citrichinensis]